MAARFGGSPYHFQRNFKRLVGRDAARVRGGASPAEGQAAAARRQRRHRCDARRGLRVEQPLLRTSGAQARHAADTIPARGRRHGHPLRDRRLAARTAARGGDGARRLCCGDGPLGPRSRTFVGARVSSRDAFPKIAGRSIAGSRRCWRTSRAGSPVSICRSTSGPPPFNGRSGRRWRRFRTVKRASYAEVASAIGRPRASRAVARACASNPVALAIPCHRVVPAAGGVGGLSLGIGAKASPARPGAVRLSACELVDLVIW